MNQIILADDQRYPCSWDQARVLEDYRAGVPPYGGPVHKRWTIEGDITAEEVRSAWVEVLVKHPSLRVGYSRDAVGRWLQTVLPLSAVEDWIVVEDNLSEDDLETVWNRVDLRQGQLLSVVIVKTGPKALIVDLAVHLVCIDGASLTLILAEVGLTLSNRRAEIVYGAGYDIEFFRFCSEYGNGDFRSLTAGPRYRPSGWSQRGPVLDLSTTGSESHNSGLDVASFRIDWSDELKSLQRNASGLGISFLVRYIVASGIIESYGEVPVIVGLFGRPLGFHEAVGRFYSESVTGFSGTHSDISSAAQGAAGKLLRTARAPITPLSFELLNSRIDPRIRAYSGEQSPPFLFAVHTAKRAPFRVDGCEVVELAVADETDTLDIGLLQVRSVSDESGLTITFSSRRSALGTGVANEIVATALEEMHSLSHIAYQPGGDGDGKA